MRAVELDPDFSSAYSLLSWSYAAEAESHWCEARSDALKLAIEYSMKALELDEFDSNAHSGLAWAFMYQKKFKLAELHVDRAIECNPNNYHLLTGIIIKTSSNYSKLFR